MNMPQLTPEQMAELQRSRLEQQKKCNSNQKIVDEIMYADKWSLNTYSFDSRCRKLPHRRESLPLPLRRS